MTLTNKKRSIIIPLLLCAIFAFYSFTSLSLMPAPWPDDSAFFLPGLDWFTHFKYRMHAQAAFVPSYDIANFNTMPLLPFLLGFFFKTGVITNVQGIHTLALFPYFLASLAMFRFLKSKTDLWSASLVSLGFATSPALRWGSTIFRPETFIGFIILLLMFLIYQYRAVACRFSKNSTATHAKSLKARNKLCVQVAGLLAIGAYIHFEAIYIVPPIAVILLFLNKPLIIWGRVTLWTLLFLTPWFIYIGIHFTDFWTQMQTQFGRLDEHHPYIKSAHSLFHSLFLHNGSATGYPKFFNLGKILTWVLVILTGSALLKNPKKITQTPFTFSMLLFFFSAMYLWFDKPETWFTTLIHYAIWGSFAFLVIEFRSATIHKIGLTAVALLIVLQFATSVAQWREAKDLLTWNRYNDWTDCISDSTANASEIWQPGWPDALIHLASKAPDKSYTRAVDFQNIEPLIINLANRLDAIIHSVQLPLNHPWADSSWDAKTTAEDLKFFNDYPWTAFPEIQPGKKIGPGSWQAHTCHYGPYFAIIYTKI